MARFLVVVMLLVLHLMLPAAKADEVNPGGYTVGVVPQFESRKIVEIWQPILDEVSASSGIELKLIQSPNIPEFEKQFSEGKFDFAYMNPYHLIVAHDEQKYLPILKDIERKLFGIIVVKKESPIQNIMELDGKTLAFPAPNALGAALIPRAEFSKKYNIKVNEMYVKSHSSVYLNVLLGVADAGGGVQKTLSQEKAEVKDNLRILYKTQQVSPHPIAVHPRVPGNVREKVTEAFLQLGKTEQGSGLLAKVPFRKIGKATLDDYQPLRSMGLSEFYVR